VASPLDRKTPLAKSRHRGSSRVRQPARCLDQGGERRALVLRQHRDNERQFRTGAGEPTGGGFSAVTVAELGVALPVHSIHLGNVGEVWPLSLVAFLRADSNSCAVFAAATIEFIGVFNV